MKNIKTVLLLFIGTSLTASLFQNCGMSRFKSGSNFSSSSLALPFVNSMFSGVTRNNISSITKVSATGQSTLASTAQTSTQTTTQTTNNTVATVTTPAASQSKCFTNVDGVCGQGEVAPVISVSNSADGPFVVNGTVCNNGKFYLRTTNAKGILSGCIARGGVKDCETTYLTKDNYKPYNSADFVNDSTIQTSMDANILPVGTYDAYMRGFVTLIPMYTPKASVTGTFTVVDNCSQVASSNQSGAVTQAGATAPRTEPQLIAGTGNMQFSVSNVDIPRGQYDQKYPGYVCNQGQIYATITGTTYGYGFRGCVTPAGTAGCNDIANYHIFDDGELPPGYYPEAKTKAEASSFPVGKYDAYVAYSAKSITKLNSFTVKSCTPELGCEAMEPRCEGNDFVRRNSCKEIERWVNAPDCVARVAAVAPVTTTTCTVLEPTCEGKDYVRRDSCGKEIGRWVNAPPPYCTQPTVDTTGQGS